MSTPRGVHWGDAISQKCPQGKFCCFMAQQQAGTAATRLQRRTRGRNAPPGPGGQNGGCAPWGQGAGWRGAAESSLNPLPGSRCCFPDVLFFFFFFLGQEGEWKDCRGRIAWSRGRVRVTPRRSAAAGGCSPTLGSAPRPLPTHPPVLSTPCARRLLLPPACTRRASASPFWGGLASSLQAPPAPQSPSHPIPPRPPATPASPCPRSSSTTSATPWPTSFGPPTCPPARPSAPAAAARTGGASSSPSTARASTAATTRFSATRRSSTGSVVLGTGVAPWGGVPKSTGARSPLVLGVGMWTLWAVGMVPGWGRPVGVLGRGFWSWFGGGWVVSIPASLPAWISPASKGLPVSPPALAWGLQVGWEPRGDRVAPLRGTASWDRSSVPSLGEAPLVLSPKLWDPWVPPQPHALPDPGTTGALLPAPSPQTSTTP